MYTIIFNFGTTHVHAQELHFDDADEALYNLLYSFGHAPFVTLQENRKTVVEIELGSVVKIDDEFANWIRENISPYAGIRLKPGMP